MADDKPTVTFGFRTVAEDARQRLVNDVFATVADRYDVMNDLMSGGLHRLWKDDFTAWLAPPRGAQSYEVLDVAGGTGDIALRVSSAAGSSMRVTVCDISPEMLAVGQRRIEKAGVRDRIRLVAGNAECLPFSNRSFDAYTIGFGIRNVTHIEQALNEAFRVLKFGGRFMCLEFSRCEVPMLDRLYDFHSFEVIPRLGQWIAGSRAPYEYLVESIRNFPDQERFSEMICEAGFERVSHRNLSGGVAAIHSGWKI